MGTTAPLLAGGRSSRGRGALQAERPQPSAKNGADGACGGPASAQAASTVTLQGSSSPKGPRDGPTSVTAPAGISGLL